MYAQLGNIRFEGLRGFSSFEETFAVNYAQHDRINGKPRLQAVGETLDAISFEMLLHARFTDVEADVAELKAAMKSREIMPLILGTGRVLGNFVIPNLTLTTSYTDGAGNLIEATLSVELLECYNDDPIREQLSQARNSAFATETRNSNIRAVLPPKLSTGMAVSKNVAKIETSGKLISQHVAAADQNPNAYEYYSGKISEALTGIEGQIQEVQTAISSVPGLSALAPLLPAALDAVNSAVQNMAEDLPIYDVIDFRDFNNSLQSAIKNAKSASVGINNQSIIRRI